MLTLVADCMLGKPGGSGGVSGVGGGAYAIAIACVCTATDVTGTLTPPADRAADASDASDDHAVNVATLALAAAPLAVVI